MVCYSNLESLDLDRHVAIVLTVKILLLNNTSESFTLTQPETPLS